MLHNYLVSNYQFKVTSVLNSELLGIRLLIWVVKLQYNFKFHFRMVRVHSSS